VSRALVGTSGWSYPSWRPGFYPSDCRPEEFLSYYADLLPTVELNSTKYRLPSHDQFEAWAAQVPDDFRFAVKAPPGVERRLDMFQQRVLALGDRLGCVRVVIETQRNDGLIELLLGSTDPTLRWALDLRDASWDGIEPRLTESGAVRVDDESGAAGWAYLRFRELQHTAAELAAISSRLRGLEGRDIETFAYFRHSAEPTAPQEARAVDRAENPGV
jgi:uncharacterized protein YecE (DUF72 family)